MILSVKAMCYAIQAACHCPKSTQSLCGINYRSGN